jgi:hypothetical protein
MVNQFLYITEDGSTCWINGFGVYHKVDEPAILHKNGGEEWWIDGKRHRLDGPAVTVIVDNIVTYEWWIGGKRHRRDGPAVIVSNGTEEWWMNDMRHRHDGPAVTKANGIRMWYFAGKRHRLDGPAFVSKTTKAWYIHGEQVKKNDPRLKGCGLETIFEDVEFRE